MARYNKRILWLLGAIPSLAVLYILSIGPMTSWVINAVGGAQSPQAAASTYDQRLHVYYSFYRPFFRARSWTLFRVTHLFEDHFWRYERLFIHPRKLADGREVYSTVGLPVVPGETTTDYVHRLFGSTEPTPKQGTEVHPLPRCGRVLIILDPNEDDQIRFVLTDSVEYSLALYAELRVP